MPQLLHALESNGSRIQLHIYCAMSTELVHRLEGGELDLTLGIRCVEPSEGRMLCDEEVVWASNPDFDLLPTAPAPLALYPPGCPFYARALTALALIGRQGKVVYTSQNPTGIEVPVRLGLGVTVCSLRTLRKVLQPDGGFPRLAPAELELHRSPRALHAALDVVETLLEARFRGP